MLEFAPMLFELAVDDELTMFDELSLLLESIFEGAVNSLLFEILLEFDFLLLDELFTLELFLLLEILLELDSLLDELLILELSLLLLETLLELDSLLDELFTLELFLLLLETLL